MEPLARTLDAIGSPVRRVSPRRISDSASVCASRRQVSLWRPTTASHSSPAAAASRALRAIWPLR